MSRLLHAAARGARVQRQQQTLRGDSFYWEDVDIQWGLDDELRIHPEDARLAYGPISTALRDDAANGTTNRAGVFVGTYGEWAFAYKEWFEYNQSDDELHRSLFLLILSEALADEGL